MCREYSITNEGWFLSFFVWSGLSLKGAPLCPVAWSYTVRGCSLNSAPCFVRLGCVAVAARPSILAMPPLRSVPVSDRIFVILFSHLASVPISDAPKPTSVGMPAQGCERVPHPQSVAPAVSARLPRGHRRVGHPSVHEANGRAVAASGPLTARCPTSTAFRVAGQRARAAPARSHRRDGALARGDC